MSGKTMLILLGKEYKLLFKNKLFIAFSVVLLFVFIGLYIVLPNEIGHEEPVIAIYTEVDAKEFFDAWDNGIKAMSYVKLDSSDELLSEIEQGNYVAGFIITEQIWRDISEGKQGHVELFFAPGLAEEYVTSFEFLVEIAFSEMTYRKEGDLLNITTEEIFIGKDIMGSEVPLKKMMIPLMICVLFIMEIFALGISLVEEIESRSLKAVLIAPVSMYELLVAKGITGISVSLIQSFIFLLATGSLTTQALAIIMIILLGAVLTTGVSALLAAFSTDMMSLVTKGIFAMLILMIPLLGIIIPGFFSSWVSIIPTYILADSLNQLINEKVIFDVLKPELI